MKEYLENEKLRVGLKVLLITAGLYGVYGLLFNQVCFIISPEFYELMHLDLENGTLEPMDKSWVSIAFTTFFNSFRTGIGMGLVVGGFAFWMETNMPYYKVKFKSVIALLSTIVVGGVIGFGLSKVLLPHLFDFFSQLSMPANYEEFLKSESAEKNFITVLIMQGFNYFSILPALLIACVYQYKQFRKG